MFYFMLTKFLDPKNDMAFKKIFGTEKNKDILIHFLNDILEFKEKLPIIDVQFLKPVQDPAIASRKTSIVDVQCVDELGNIYIVEMQVSKDKSFIKRAQYYAAKAYGSQLKIGEKFDNLKEVIFLAIADFIMFPDKAGYKSEHVILDKHSFEHDLKDFSFTFLELEKFNKPVGQLYTMIDKWAYFFKHARETSIEDLPNIIGQDMIIQRAYEELICFNWNEEELNTYEAVIKNQMDYEAGLDQKYDEGIAKGIEQIAISMLKKGLEPKFISEITKLSIKEITKL